jgi:hypothetical protein
VVVEWVQNTVGKIHFGHGYHRKMTIAVWQTEVGMPAPEPVWGFTTSLQIQRYYPDALRARTKV